MSKSIAQSKLFKPIVQTKPLAVRAGEFFFLAGQTPHDPETGRLVTSLQDIKDRAKGILDLNEYESLWDSVLVGPIVSQAFTILANIKAILFENGLSLENIVKVNIYITDFQDLPAFYKVWKQFFPKPMVACSIVGIPTVGMNPNIRVTMDCIAALPERISPKQIQRFTSDNQHVWLGGCAAVKAGDLIFISGHVGVNEEGNAILKCKEVGDEAYAYFRENIPTATARTEAAVAQSWSIFKQINDLLKQMGSSGDNILASHTFAKTVRDRHNVMPISSIFYPHDPPAGTSYRYESIYGSEDYCIQVEAIATLPGKKKVFNFDYGLVTPTWRYSMATKAGQYVFLAGRAGINWQKNGEPVVFPDDLTPWGGQHIMVGRLEQEKPVFLQAWYIYESMKKILEQVGATLDDVVKTSIGITDVADLPLVERARDYFFKNNLPVETIIPINGTTMHRELTLEMEPIIVIGK